MHDAQHLAVSLLLVLICAPAFGQDDFFQPGWTSNSGEGDSTLCHDQLFFDGRDRDLTFAVSDQWLADNNWSRHCDNITPAQPTSLSSPMPAYGSSIEPPRSGRWLCAPEESGNTAIDCLHAPIDAKLTEGRDDRRTSEPNERWSLKKTSEPSLLPVHHTQSADPVFNRVVREAGLEAASGIATGRPNKSPGRRQATDDGHRIEGATYFESTAQPLVEDVPELIPQPVPSGGQSGDPLIEHNDIYVEQPVCNPCNERSYFAEFLSRWQGPRSPEGGVGRLRLGLAPMQIDAAEPGNSLGIRVESVYNLTLPDRGEMFWARPSNLTAGKGPAAPEPAVSYQDIRFVTEVGGKSFSVTTEIPIRVLDPTVNLNTAGLSDMVVTTKTVLLDGTDWLLTQVFKTYTPTGAFRKGLGTGHTSLEPGILARYRYNDEIYLHSELKYWFAVGGDPVHSGQALRYGLGTSWIYSDFDAFAILPSLELAGFWVLDGQKTILAGGAPQAIDIDKEFVIHFFPSVRLVSDNGGDFGLFELAIGGGFDLGSLGWHDGLLRIEFRWSQ